MAVRYEAELRELHQAGVIDDATVSRAVAIDRGALFSVFEELRIGLYVAVTLLTVGIGIFIKEHLDRIGAVAIVAGLVVIAALCYAAPIRAQWKGEKRSLSGDYLLLLGALTLSAAVAYAESQFHWLDANWSWHLLGLALVHGATAYVLDSRLVLSVALVSLAGWFAVEHDAIDILRLEGQPRDFGWRALICAAVILGARGWHVRSNTQRRFEEVFDHFVANIAFWGALVWCVDARLRWWGALLLTALAVVALTKGLRAKQELFVVYGVGYAAIGYSLVTAALLSDPLATSSIVLAITIAAAVALWKFHGDLKDAEA